MTNEISSKDTQKGHENLQAGDTGVPCANCGHEKEDHRKDTCIGSLYCECKKFKAQNHKLDENTLFPIREETGSGDSLSDKMSKDKEDLKDGAYVLTQKDVKEAVKKNKKVDSQVLDFLEGLKELRINDKLPFGTCDYHEIDRLIEEIKNKDKIFGSALV